MQAFGIDAGDALVLRFHAEQELRVAAETELGRDARVGAVRADEIADALAAIQLESAGDATRTAIGSREAQMRARPRAPRARTSA